MKKIISLFMFGLLLSLPFGIAKESIGDVDNFDTEYDYADDYNFDDNSFYISDEQAQDVKDIDKIEDYSSFDDKVINSGHFTSGTATRTWIPINKVK